MNKLFGILLAVAVASPAAALEVGQTTEPTVELADTLEAPRADYRCFRLAERLYDLKLALKMLGGCLSRECRMVRTEIELEIEQVKFAMWSLRC